MAKSMNKRKRTPKAVLKLPDLEQSKSAVLNSLTSPSSQRTYDHNINCFARTSSPSAELSANKPSELTACPVSNTGGRNYFGQAIVRRKTLSVFASMSCKTSWSRVSRFPPCISMTCP